MDAGHLGEVVARERYLAVINHYAGKAKDGALDLRITAGAFGWFQVTETLRWLRDRLPGLDQDRRRALLRDFAPLLVLLTQEQADGADRREVLAAERADAAAEARAAELDARRAEALLAHHAGKALTQEELLDLALTRAEALAAAEHGQGQQPGPSVPKARPEKARPEKARPEKARLAQPKPGRKTPRDPIIH